MRCTSNCEFTRLRRRVRVFLPVRAARPRAFLRIFEINWDVAAAGNSPGITTRRVSFEDAITLGSVLKRVAEVVRLSTALVNPPEFSRIQLHDYRISAAESSFKTEPSPLRQQGSRVTTHPHERARLRRLWCPLLAQRPFATTSTGVRTSGYLTQNTVC